MGKRFLHTQEIAWCAISKITTKAPCKAAHMGEHHVRIETSAFVLRPFVRTGAPGGAAYAQRVYT